MFGVVDGRSEWVARQAGGPWPDRQVRDVAVVVDAPHLPTPSEDESSASASGPPDIPTLKTQTLYELGLAAVA